VLAAPFAGGIPDTRGLEKPIEQHMTRDVMVCIAARVRNGRNLRIRTPNLDSLGGLAGPPIANRLRTACAGGLYSGYSLPQVRL
jgi:hypothetical protein